MHFIMIMFKYLFSVSFVENYNEKYLNLLLSLDNYIYHRDSATDLHSCFMDVHTHMKSKEQERPTVKVENISFINIQGTSATKGSIKFACSDAFPCEGLYLEYI